MNSRIRLSIILIVSYITSYSQAVNYKIIEPSGNEYKTRFPVTRHEDIDSFYSIFSSAERYVNSRDSTDRYIVRKSDNKFLHKLLVNEKVFPNESGGLLVFESRYIKSTSSSEGETLRSYEVYLTTIESPDKITPQEKLYDYIEHDWVKNKKFEPAIYGNKIAFNKKTNQLYVLSNTSQFKVYEITKNQKEVIEGVSNFKFDSRINEDYLEITFKNTDKIVYDCKKMKPAKVSLEFPKIKFTEEEKVNPLIQNAAWTFEYGGSFSNFSTAKKELNLEPSYVTKITSSIIEIRHKDKYSGDIRYVLYDLKKNKMIWVSEVMSSRDPSFTVYNKDGSEIFVFEPHGIRYYDLTIQPQSAESVYLDGIYDRKKKENSKYYNNQIAKAWYNETLRQLYWHLPNDNKSVIYDLANKDFKVIENSSGLDYNQTESTQHLLIKNSNQTTYYYDCKTFKKTGDKLPIDAPKKPVVTDNLDYKFNSTGNNELTIYQGNSIITSIKLPKSQIEYAFIDQANKNVVYYCKESSQGFFKTDFVYLNTKDSIDFQKNNKLLADKKKLAPNLNTNSYWEKVPAEFAVLNKEANIQNRAIRDSLAKYYSTKKWNYFDIDTSLFTNNKKEKGKYPYYFEYPSDYEDLPLVKSDRSTLTKYDTPDIYKLDTNKILLSFYGKLCMVNLTTDSANFYTFSRGRTTIDYLNNDLFLLNGEYVCNLKKNSFVGRIVFKKGDFQRQYNKGNYVYIIEAVNYEQTLLQVIDVTNFEIVKQDTVQSGFYKLFNSDPKNGGIYFLSTFDFGNNYIVCNYLNSKYDKKQVLFNYSKNAIKKNMLSSEKFDLASSIYPDKVYENQDKSYMSNLVRWVDFSYLYIDINENYRYNTNSPDFKDDYNVHMSFDAKYKGKMRRYKFGKEKVEVAYGTQNVQLSSKTKVVLEKCPKCAGQKSWGGERSNCGKCGGSGFDASKKCTARGCVYGYQTVETLKTAGSVLKNGMVAYTEKEKKKCIWCLGTEKGLCSECGGKGGKVSEVITCDKCKGSGWLNKTVAND